MSYEKGDWQREFDWMELGEAKYDPNLPQEEKDKLKEELNVAWGCVATAMSGALTHCQYRDADAFLDRFADVAKEVKYFRQLLLRTGNL